MAARGVKQALRGIDTSNGETGTASDGSALLVQGLRSRDAHAFEQAVARYSGSMLAVARSIVGPAQAEDVVQDAWLAVYQKIASFEGRASFAVWLKRIVVNRAISWLRSTVREVPGRLDGSLDPAEGWFDDAGAWVQGPVAWDSPEALLSADALQRCIAKHLERMPANQRRVVVMRDVEGMNFEEIGSSLGLSTSNVRVLLHRGRLRLANMVNDFHETGGC